MLYEVKAIRGGEKVATLAIQAQSPERAAEEARRNGVTVLSVRARLALPRPLRPAPRRFALLLFCQQLIALLSAGLNVVEALEALAENERSGAPNEVLTEVVARLREGQSFSQALATDPTAFPPFFVATVRASERTGQLEDALRRFVAYQTQIDAIQRKIVNASIYPALLLGTGLLVFAFLLGYVVPRFATVLSEARGEIPWGTQLLIAWGTLVRDHGGALLAAALAAIAAIGYGLSHAPLRGRLARVVWRIGPFAERLRLYQYARFYRTVGMLLEGGIPVLQALDMAGGLLSAPLAGRLGLARRRVQEGVAISAALAEAGLSTPIADRLLRVGERGGAMGELMHRIAAFLEDELARWVEWFTRLFEPVLMAVIGILIGTIVALMYVPIFDLADSIQ